MKKLLIIIGIGLLFLSSCSSNKSNKHNRSQWTINKEHIIYIEGKQFYTVEVNSTGTVVGLIPVF